MHTVGSVVAIGNNKFVVAGYRPIDKDGSVEMGYLLVPYPLGFVNIDSFSLIAPEQGQDLVHPGYRNDDAASYDVLLEQVQSLGQHVTLDEMLKNADEAMAELSADIAAIEAEEVAQ